jgi:pimeloyl-ACP methyl ester carboxylesterase
MDACLPQSVISGGAKIRYGVSGCGDHDVVLIHGSGAHHMWWHAITPQLEKHWRVITLDLSGHGDSAHRPSYEPSHWADEIRDVLDAVGSERALYVGHSMGGRIGISFAAKHPQRAAGIVVFDAGIKPPAKFEILPTRQASAETKVYPRYEEAVARFRLLPLQPEPHPSILDPIRQYSLKEVTGGWTWKHDPRSLRRFDPAELDAAVHAVTCPLIYVYGSNSAIDNEDSAKYAVEVVQGASEAIRIDKVHHHLILEEPEQCAAIIHDAAIRFQERLNEQLTGSASTYRRDEPNAIGVPPPRQLSPSLRKIQAGH